MSVVHPTLPVCLTTEERQVLQRVRDRISKEWSGYGHICIRLDIVADETPSLKEAVKSLRTYIRESLAGCCTLESWRFTNGYTWGKDRCSRSDRVQWIDWILGQSQ